MSDAPSPAAATPSALLESTPPLATRPPGWQSRTFLLAACVLSLAIFWWAGGAFGMAREYGFDGSLLANHGPVGNMIATGVLILATVVLGTLVAGFVRPDAGVFAAAVGLVALSIRGQAMPTVLLYGEGRGVFLTLALELALLYTFLGAAWYGLFSLQLRGKLQGDSLRDGLADAVLPPFAGSLALLTHVVVMGTAVVLLARSADKKQVLAAVAIAAFVGAFFPYWQHGARPSAWYWAGPLVVGVAGYLLAYVSPPEGWDIGRPGYRAGFLSALARPLPLDYASVGTAGALLGYWMRRRSLRDRMPGLDVDR